MDASLLNDIQEIKSHEQAIANIRERVRTAFVSAIKDYRNPKVRRYSEHLYLINYKDLDNWDVHLSANSMLAEYLQDKPLCETLKVVKKMESGIASDKSGINFCVSLRSGKGMTMPMQFEIKADIAKAVLEMFYDRLKVAQGIAHAAGM